MRRRSKSKYQGFEPPSGQKKTAGWSRGTRVQTPPTGLQARPPVPRPDLEDLCTRTPGPTMHDEFATGGQTAQEELPPLDDWPPPEIKARWAAQRERQRRNRELRRKSLLGLVVIAALVAGIVALTKIGGKGHAHPAATPPRSELLAWSVNLGAERLVTVVAVPGDRPPVAVAIPNATQVDIPGGPATVGAASSTTGLTIAAVQASLGRRVDHYLITDASTVMSLVNQVGGVTVQAESSFSFQGQELGPGQVKLTGGAVLAYLESAAEADLAGRWEEVLSGLFSSRARRDLWDQLTGESDSLSAARSILTGARGAIVLELPTAPTPDGGVQVDPKGLAQLLQQNLGTAGGALVRVVLLNGTGRKDIGGPVSSVLAPEGFQVVAIQEASRRIIASTEVVASDDSFLPEAQQVQQLLKVGTVYVGTQPTGIADITIVMGKDYQPD